MRYLIVLFTAFFAINTSNSQINKSDLANQLPQELIVSIQESPEKKQMPLTFVTSGTEHNMDFSPKLNYIKSANKAPNPNEVYQYKIDNQDLKGRFETDNTNVFFDAEDDSRENSFAVTEQFYGDIDGGCPNDNTIAIANNGKIISMMNTGVGIYDENGNTINLFDLGAFFFNYIGDPCDPKVEYDPVSDKFVAFVQACGNYKDKIGIAFSQTNDPNGNWYVYILSSDALGDGSWGDYPKLAITNDEVFISLNQYTLTDNSYKYSVIYQIDKQSGYTGQNLNYKIWKDVGFTSVIARSGTRQYGPGAYVISSNSGQGNSILFGDITGNVDDSNSKFVTYDVPTAAYTVPFSANQAGTSDLLDTGDSRGMDAYYQNGIVHFVHTVSDNGYGAVRYYRLDPTNLDGYNFFTTTDSGNKDYAYPSISPFTKDWQDQTSIIFFAASGSNYAPELRAKVFKSDFSTQASQMIFAGSGPCLSCLDPNRNAHRWGDYSSVAVKYNNNQPTVWVAGSIAGSGSNIWWTYLAELTSIGNTTSTIDENSTSSVATMPNPAQDRFEVEIQTEQSELMDFLLYDQMGKLSARVYTGTVRTGHQDLVNLTAKY